MGDHLGPPFGPMRTRHGPPRPIRIRYVFFGPSLVTSLPSFNPLLETGDSEFHRASTTPDCAPTYNVTSVPCCAVLRLRHHLRRSTAKYYLLLYVCLFYCRLTGDRVGSYLCPAASPARTRETGRVTMSWIEKYGGKQHYSHRRIQDLAKVVPAVSEMGPSYKRGPPWS